MKPQTRRSGLLIRELPDELVVYDQEQNRAHCLNRTATLVFRQADGTRTRGELAALPGLDAAAVELALGQLAAAGLLEPAATTPQLQAAGISRRELAQRVGLAAVVLLPAVVSIVAPTPAEAAATCVSDCGGKTPGTPCSSFGLVNCTETCASSTTGSCTDGGGA